MAYPKLEPRKRPNKVDWSLPKFEACVNCTSGWVMVWTQAGQSRPTVRRCSCWLAHQARLADLRAGA